MLWNLYDFFLHLRIFFSIWKNLRNYTNFLPKFAWYSLDLFLNVILKVLLNLKKNIECFEKNKYTYLRMLPSPRTQNHWSVTAPLRSGPSLRSLRLPAKFAVSAVPLKKTWNNWGLVAPPRRLLLPLPPPPLLSIFDAAAVATVPLQGLCLMAPPRGIWSNKGLVAPPRELSLPLHFFSQFLIQRWWRVLGGFRIIRAWWRPYGDLE